MAISANKLIVLNDVISAINTNIKAKIQDKIVWSGDKKPATFSRGTLTNHSTGGVVTNPFPELSTSTTLQNVSIDTSSGIAVFSAVYNGIISAFDDWSRVRTCKYELWDKLSEKNTTKYKETTKIGIVKSSNANIINDIKKKKNLAGLIMQAKDFNDFVTLIYNAWNESQAKNKVTWQYDLCHSSCHSDCHCHW